MVGIEGKEGTPRGGNAARGGAIAVFGATSGIARAAAEIWMARGEDLILIGRSEAALAALARDLEVAHGRKPAVFAWDAADLEHHGERFAALAAAHPLRGLFLAAGVLHDPPACIADPAKAAETFRVNLAGPAIIAELFAEHLKAKGGGGGGGFVSCLTSVAGDRGRASNYHYGASKAGLSTFLEGLRQRLHGSGVLVQDVKPGPVRTRMTAHMRPGRLWSEPAPVARAILRALDAGRETVYVPGYWRLVMAVIRAIPAPVFRRLKL